MTEGPDRSFLRVRVSEQDVHYAGGLVAGAYVLGLFGDAVTDLCLRRDNHEGLMRAYETVEFFHPVRAGDFIEVTCTLAAVGVTSRRFDLEAATRSTAVGGADDTTGGRRVVASARAVAVIPTETAS